MLRRIMTTAKAWIAFGGVLLTAATDIVADNVFEWSEVGQASTNLVTALITLIAVYRIPNKKV